MNRTTAPKLRRRGPFKALAVLMLAVAGALAFTGTASADNISVSAAQSKCRAYARGVLADTDFVSANVKSVRVFPGHNHYVRCTVSYDDAETKSTKYYACIETLDIYLLAHSGDRTRTMFMAHTSRPCGDERLTGPRPR
jgi:hypothetical protein